MLELNKETNWLHHSNTGVGIPLYENVLYALHLMRSKNKDKFLVGKDLIERVFPFQVDGNFPKYLHSYPRCYHKWQMVDLLVPFFYMINEFEFALPHLREQIEPLLQAAISLEDLPGPTHFKRACLLNAFGLCSELPTIPQCANEEDLFEVLLGLQLVDVSQDDFRKQINWSMELERIITPDVRQKGYEKEFSLIELALRKKEADSADTLPLILVQNLEFSPPQTLQTQPLIRYWGSPQKSHSLSLWTKHLIDENFVVNYPDLVPPLDRTDDAGEIALYLDASQETTFRVNERPTISFTPGDVCRINTPLKEFALSFELLDGQGEFRAHISKGNRPSQILKTGEAYDWAITLRTLRRGPCRLKVHLEEIKKEESPLTDTP
jgi:hypothetical protein